ncbi:MAG TPA: histone deacetylase [Blastocatellia bacterium]|nr:histone deacetylase [Blastocatellia bacterium]
MRVSYSDRCQVPLTPTHPFPMPKYRMTRDRLLAEGTLTHWHLIEPGLVSDEDLLLVHEPAYWRRCATGQLTAAEVRRIGFPWSEALVRRARVAVQGTTIAARNALRDGVASNLAGGTHHAFPDHGEGYCILNDIAIAVRVLQRDGLARRVAVIDCDVHQGNGTAAIFSGDADVFTFSIHGEKNFPLRKERSRLDVNLPDGTGDREYLKALGEHVPGILEEFLPDIVFYQAGVDPHERDRLGKLRLTLGGLRQRDEFVIGACRRAGVPVVTTMGGGYGKDISETVEGHCNTVRVAISFA